MSGSKYFQDELTYLKEAGGEFAKYHPKLSQFLSEGSFDPDVERLLEGFSFLSGRIREKIDDELPELTQSLMTLLWPHYMRSVPSMCISELTPLAGSLTEKTIVSKGKEMASVPVEGTSCIFKTCYDTALYPIEINTVEQTNTRSNSRLEITLSTLQGLDITRINMDSLRFYLHGEPHITRSFYLWLFRYLDYVELEVSGYSQRLSSEQVTQVGFKDDEAILPYGKQSFAGYRLLQEYFSFPEKFMFFDLNGLSCLSALSSLSSIKISFVFNRALPEKVQLRTKHFKLHCTPAVNLFSMDADPIRLDHRQNDYKVRPQSENQEHFEVYSIEDVNSWNETERRQKTLIQFESFEHQINQREKQEFYKSNVHERISGRGLEHKISFHSHAGAAINLDSETVLMKLTCSNASLAERLSVGDICHITNQSPSSAIFRNITKPTQAISPQINGELQWQLIANMSLNYLSLSNIEVLKVMLSTYDFHSRIDRQTHRASLRRLDGLKSSYMSPIDRVFRGVSMRGSQFNLVVDSSLFINEGDMFLMGSILSEFIRLYATVNSFTELKITDDNTREVYHWPFVMGQQTVL